MGVGVVFLTPGIREPDRFVKKQSGCARVQECKAVECGDTVVVDFAKACTARLIHQVRIFSAFGKISNIAITTKAKENAGKKHVRYSI